MMANESKELKKSGGILAMRQFKREKNVDVETIQKCIKRHKKKLLQ